STDRVVSVIEILSPSNKKLGEDREKYLRKRYELAAAQINLVEVDLLRAGIRELGTAKLQIPQSYVTTYQACVHRGWKRQEFEVYRLPLRERLPRIRIPLRETDADVVLDLQLIVDQCYVNCGYDDIDYRAEPSP